MDSKSYYEDLKKSCIFFVAVLSLFIFIDLFNIRFIDELTGANLILSVIAVPCCILHYCSDKNSSFFIYILIFSSTCIEAVSKWYQLLHNVYIIDLLFPFAYRVFLLILLLYSNSNFVKKCTEHAKIVFTISCLIDFILVFLNCYIINHTNLNLNMTLLFFIVASISYIVIIK